jgi:hypothetical protein
MGGLHLVEQIEDLDLHRHIQGINKRWRAGADRSRATGLPSDS